MFALRAYHYKEGSPLSGTKTIRWIWLTLIGLYVLTAPFEGYWVVPGFHGHSWVSLFQRILLFPLPAVTLYLVLRRKDRLAMLPLGLITAWIIWVLFTFVLFSPHSYYYLYYTWEQIAGFLLILSFWYLARFQSFSRITTIASLLIYYGATLFLSQWEIQTHHHLGASTEHHTAIPTAFSYGPNHLGAAVALIIPFVSLLFLLKRSWWVLAASILFSLWGIYILYKTGSRAGELAVMLEAIGLAVLLPKRWKYYAIASIGALFVIIGAALFLVVHLPATDMPFALVKFRHLAHIFNGAASHSSSQGPGSFKIRIALLESGFRALWHHPWGLGPRGAEGYYAYYVHHKSPYNTYGVIDAHNMWLEVAIDFGWLGISLYTGFYGLLLLGLYRLRRHTDATLRYISWAGFPALIGFVIGSLSPSSVMIGFNIMWIVYGLAMMAIYQNAQLIKTAPHYPSDIRTSGFVRTDMTSLPFGFHHSSHK